MQSYRLNNPLAIWRWSTYDKQEGLSVKGQPSAFHKDGGWGTGNIGISIFFCISITWVTLNTMQEEKTVKQLTGWHAANDDQLILWRAAKILSF